MSRIGNSTITIPDNVTVNIASDSINVKGPKGELTQPLHRLISVKLDEGKLKVTKSGDSKLANSLNGTFQRLIENMVTGTTQGFHKNLELVGTGYRVNKQGDKIVLSLGYSHPIEFKALPGIQIDVEGNNKITVSGIDKQLVGQTAATIRAFRPPEPYKGKGVKYENEVIRRKAGKTAKAA